MGHNFLSTTKVPQKVLWKKSPVDLTTQTDFLSFWGFLGENIRHTNWTASQIENSSISWILKVSPACLSTHNAQTKRLSGFLLVASRKLRVFSFWPLLDLPFLPSATYRGGQPFIPSHYLAVPDTAFSHSVSPALWLSDTKASDISQKSTGKLESKGVCHTVTWRPQGCQPHFLPPEFHCPRPQGGIPPPWFSACHSKVRKVLIIFSTWNLRIQNSPFQGEN